MLTKYGTALARGDPLEVVNERFIRQSERLIFGVDPEADVDSRSFSPLRNRIF